MTSEFDRFLDALQTAHAVGQFQKCTLSKASADAPPDLKNIFLRPVEIKGKAMFSATFRYKTRDEAKNFSPADIGSKLAEWMPAWFLNADFFATEQEGSLNFDKKGAARLALKKANRPTPPPTQHNREKTRLLDPASPWLHALGIANAKGEVLPTAQDKWRQINKFLEIIASLVQQMPGFPGDPQVADMGSGKGYLTFALYDFFKNKLGLSPQVTGIELRPNLVDFCNKTAQKVGFEGLRFVAENIEDFKSSRLDLLIALHACDTATDLALAKGIRAGARAIVVAPCCHKQIRRDMETRNELAPILRFGILEERQAEIVTDGIRALLLEANGFKTNVFEFISTEHTAKNVMITALRPERDSGEKQRSAALEKVTVLKAGFGVREHYLETLLTQ